MSALRRDKGREAGSTPFGARFSADSFVLPRLLRRPVRLFARLGVGDYAVPRFAATMATAALLSATGIYGAYISGQGPVYVQAVTGRTGFAIDEVRVTGHRETSEIDILERLDLTGWTSLIGFDASEARARIAALPWVKTVAVRKIYPRTIEVEIEEKQAFAIWQHGDQLDLVERSGAVIAPFDGGRMAALPLVIGTGAAIEAVNFVDRVKGRPEFAARVKGYIRVANRRWDLRLDNGVTVRLPEHGEDAAIDQLVAIDGAQDLLSRDIAAVDLRLADRLVIHLTPAALDRRDAAQKADAKAAKKKPRKTT